jgi:hyperosmotically inducible periplasmic protein
VGEHHKILGERQVCSAWLEAWNSLQMKLMKLSNLAKTHAAIVIAVLILMGCTAMTGRQSVGEAFDDSTITAKVKSSLLADSVVSASTIDVDTTNGAVSLNGIVKSEQERQRAIQLAQTTQGVRVVDARNLVVRR